jgi:hypothetical protein
MGIEDRTIEAHSPTIERLHAALANCIEVFFDGWALDWSKWSISVAKSANLKPTRNVLYDYDQFLFFYAV